MKTRFLTLVTILGVTILIMNSCSFLRGTGSTSTDSGVICLNYSNDDMNVLPVALVHDMVEGYRENQLSKINNNISRPPVVNNTSGDAHSVWHDLETIKRFIYQIEHNTIKNDATKSSKDLGIRFYYSAYPEKTHWERKEYNSYLDGHTNHIEKQKYGKYHTLIMVPTRKEGTLNIDFNPLDKNTYNNNLKSPVNLKYSKSYNRELRANNENNSSSVNRNVTILGLSSETGNQNSGSLIPPRSPNLGEEGF